AGRRRQVYVVETHSYVGDDLHSIERIDDCASEFVGQLRDDGLLAAHALLQLFGAQAVVRPFVVDCGVLFQILDSFRINALRHQHLRLHWYHSLLWQNWDFWDSGSWAIQWRGTCCAPAIKWRSGHILRARPRNWP